MIIVAQGYENKGLRYTVRSASPQDALQLSALRLKIEGETENLDRVQGEAFIGPRASGRL